MKERNVGFSFNKGKYLTKNYFVNCVEIACSNFTDFLVIDANKKRINLTDFRKTLSKNDFCDICDNLGLDINKSYVRCNFFAKYSKRSFNLKKEVNKFKYFYNFYAKSLNIHKFIFSFNRISKKEDLEKYKQNIKDFLSKINKEYSDIEIFLENSGTNSHHFLDNASSIKEFIEYIEEPDLTVKLVLNLYRFLSSYYSPVTEEFVFKNFIGAFTDENVALLIISNIQNIKSHLNYTREILTGIYELSFFKNIVNCDQLKKCDITIYRVDKKPKNTTFAADIINLTTNEVVDYTKQYDYFIYND